MDDEMVMGRGVERNANVDIERMLNVFYLHFSTPAEKEFAPPKLREICKYLLVLAIQTVMPVGYTILLLSAKQSRENQCNGASRLKKNVSEKLSVIYPL
jgi:hypothetical protein